MSDIYVTIISRRNKGPQTMWKVLLYAIAVFFAILAGFSLLLDKEIQTGFVIFCCSVAAFTFWRARKRSKINLGDPAQRPVESLEDQKPPTTSSMQNAQVSERPELKDEKENSMATAKFEFQIKRGVVDVDGCEQETIELIEKAKTLCQSGDTEEACNLILDSMDFEFDWEGLDSDASEITEDPEAYSHNCDASNTSVSVGVDGDDLIITATTQFAANAAEGVGPEEIQEFLEENGGWAGGYLSGGWMWAGSDGDNIWLVELNGEAVEIN
ncbi:hypothetical protein N8Z55_04730 [Pseudomonadales bacterium]|nr:hypothetical protein [Pseudomonadales bacterium]MDC1239041.1 hypothetical protein [Pseudomonadales bacterium]